MDSQLSSDIKKLSDEELLNKIREANEKQLSQIGCMAYTEVFNRALYLTTILEAESELVSQLLEEDEQFKKIHDEFKEKILDLKEVRNIEDGMSINLDELVALRKEIVLLLRSLTAYITEISYTNEIAKDKVYLEFIKANFSEIEENMDLQRLTNNVQMFLSEDARTIKSKVVDITGVLPVRVSKAKYYDMISGAFRKTLKEGSKEMIDLIINRYKSLYDGQLEKEYGVYFDRYFLKAQEARTFDFKNATDEQLNEVYNSTNEAMMEINSVANIVREYGIILNRLIAITMLQDNIKESVKSLDIKTLVTDWNNYLSNPKGNRTKIVESYKTAFNNLDKVFKENNAELHALTMENFGRNNKIDDSLKESLQRAQYVLSYINDYSLERDEIEEMTAYEPAGSAYLKEAIKSLIEFIDRNSKDMANIQRKTRMRRVISLVEGVFPTPQDFFEYFTNSLNMTSKKEESIAIANNILEIMNRYRGTGNTVKH